MSNDLDHFDEENPFAIYKLVPGNFQKAMEAIPPEFWEMTSRELEEQGKIGEVERKVKLNFWTEYERACRQNDTMKMVHVYGGVCHQTHFLKKVLTNSFKMAYILTPFEDVALIQEDLLRLAYQKEYEVLQLPMKITKTFTDQNGNTETTEMVDAKLAGVIQKMRESLENRKFGSALHRSMQVNRNVNENYNVNGPAQISGDQLKGLDVTQLEAFVKALKDGNQDDAKLVIEAKGIAVDDKSK